MRYRKSSAPAAFLGLVGATTALVPWMVTPAAADFPYAVQSAPDDCSGYRLPSGAGKRR